MKMDREIRNRLREYLRVSRDIEASLGGQARANAVRPYIDVEAALQEDARRLPHGYPQRSGHEQLLLALKPTTHRPGARIGVLHLSFVRAGAAAVVGLLFLGGLAGGVRAAGGPHLHFIPTGQPVPTHTAAPTPTPKPGDRPQP